MCPYCQDKAGVQQNTQPYPYTRLDKDGKLIQHIAKFICSVCGNPYFTEIRRGTDMGGDDKIYFQRYKQGMKMYRDYSIVYK